MAFAQHERQRDSRSRGNQHPVRLADIGDRPEKASDLGREGAVALEHKRIDQQNADRDQRQRKHHLLEDGEVLQTQIHEACLEARELRWTVDQTVFGASILRLPSQMK